MSSQDDDAGQKDNYEKKIDSDPVTSKKENQPVDDEALLIETMRREGYEFQVSPPRVLYQEIDGKKCEPIERVVVDEIGRAHV